MALKLRVTYTSPNYSRALCNILLEKKEPEEYVQVYEFQNIEEHRFAKIIKELQELKCVNEIEVSYLEPHIV